VGCKKPVEEEEEGNEEGKMFIVPVDAVPIGD
jgi:hypothetical protein